MNRLREKTWEEELKERFLREGEARYARSTLRTQRQQRFGTLPDEVMQRIEAADIEHLTSALAAVLTLRSLDELNL